MGGAAVAQSIGTWLGNRRVAGSSPRPDQNMERGLVAGEVSVHLLGTAEVPLSKAPNPQLLGRPSMGSPLTLTSLHLMHVKGPVCACVCFRPVCICKNRVKTWNFPLWDY